MVKKLAELGLVEHEPYRGVQLTATGERVALEVIRHHRLLELYLAEALGDAVGSGPRRGRGARARTSARTSRSGSPRSSANPTHDPHGDPIPDADAAHRRGRHRRLTDLDAGDRGRFVRVSDADPEMLRYLDRARGRARRQPRRPRPPAVRRARRRCAWASTSTSSAACSPRRCASSSTTDASRRHQLYSDIAARAGKNPAKAAVARKILIASWHILSRHEPFKAPTSRRPDLPRQAPLAFWPPDSPARN